MSPAIKNRMHLTSTTRRRRARIHRPLRAERLERRHLLATVTGVNPAENSLDAPTTTNVSATFDVPINAATATTDNFIVAGSSTGRRLASTATVSTDGQTVTLDPSADFHPGERVQVAATGRIQGSAGDPNVPKVWQFHTAVTVGSGQFTDSGQVLGANQDGEIRFGDLDNDGDQDFVQGGARVFLNDGSGVFSETQSLGGNEWDLADADGDGDLDVIEHNNVYLNDGNGSFTGTGQDLTPGGGATALEVGDIDGDGDVDVMVGIAYGNDLVWKNDGNGNFSNTGQSLVNLSTWDIGFGDFDNDGDLDAYSANQGPANRVWMNDGSGNFTDSGQELGGFLASSGVDVGDVDGDGDLDALVGNGGGGGAFVWVNDGSGVFTDTGQRLNTGGGQWGVRLADMDGDGHLDAWIPGWDTPSEIWLNAGDGSFSQSQSLNFSGLRRAGWVDFADVDGDGDLDAAEGNRFADGARLWINQNLQPSVSLSIDNTSIDEAAGTATVTATLSAVHTAEVTVDLGFSGTAMETADFTASAAQIVIPVGATSGSATITAVDDTADEPDETVIVEMTSASNADRTGGTVTTTILDNDDAPVPDVTLSVDNAAIPEENGVANFTATLSVVTTAAVTVDLGFSGSAAASDYTASGSQIVIAAGATSGSISVTAVQDTEEEGDETVIVDIANVTGGNESGTQQQATTITDDDAPAMPRVSSLSGTSSGFVAVFNSDFDTSTLNLYDTQASGMGAADATLVGANSGPVSGSLVLDAVDRSVTFIKSGDPLAADTYTVTLRSADNGFKRADGVLLDGDADGTPGGDFTETFTVAPAAANAVTVSLPDFVRGPGQDVRVPADATTGIPLLISEGANVRNGVLQIDYDPAMLAITGATVGSAMPAGATVTLDTATAGTANLTFTSPADLPPGSNVLVNLQANIPTVDASAIYRQQQVLDVHSVQLSDANANPIPALADDALHLVTYFADVSGNGRLNASDASQVARFAALLETGFAGSLLTDPIIAGDISGNGRINAADASLVARFAALIDVPEIPPIPGGLVLAGGGAPPEIGNSLLSPHQNRYGTEKAPAPVLASEGAEITPVYYPATDAVMADLATPGLRGSDNGASNLVLEDAIDELLSDLKDTAGRVLAAAK